MYPYMIQGDNITVVIDNVPHTINNSHIAYTKVRDAIKANDWEAVRDTIDPKKVVLNYGAGNISIQGDNFFWKNRLMHNTMTRRMIEMYQEGFDISPLVNFMENLMQNPSNRAVEELYRFLEVGNLPITPDGCFLAYKKVRGDYKDCHTGTIDNSVGQVVEMERNLVNDRAEETCSHGLHFCSLGYLQSFHGERTMILKINPRDVVSIPVDYNNTKGRCCRYEVVGEVDGNPKDAFNSPVMGKWSNTVEPEPEPEYNENYYSENDYNNDDDDYSYND